MARKRSRTGDLFAALRARGWKSKDIARRMGNRDPKVVSDAIAGRKRYANLEDAARALEAGDVERAEALATMSRRRDARGRVARTRAGGVRRTGPEQRGFLGTGTREAQYALIAAQLGAMSSDDKVRLTMTWRLAIIDGDAHENVDVQIVKGGGVKLRELRKKGFRGTVRSLARSLARLCSDERVVGRAADGTSGGVRVPVDAQTYEGIKVPGAVHNLAYLNVWAPGG